MKACGKLYRDLTLIVQDRFYLGGTDYQEGFFVLCKLLHGLDERRFFLTVRRLGFRVLVLLLNCLIKRLGWG